MRFHVRAWSLLCPAILSALALCSSVAAEEPAPRGKGLLIVAPEKFLPALAPYVEHKQKQLSTTLASLDKILADGAGVDDPEKLKRYLFQEWRSKNLGYVLLVGDADVMPVRYITLDRVTPAAFDIAFYASDLYYSDLARRDGEFDDWNAAKDSFHANYFGEVRGEKNKDDKINYDEIDYRPDVAVGRWPVRSAEEVRTVADKTIAYETGVLEGTKPGLRRAALMNVAGWVDARWRLDHLGEGLGAAWSVDKLYYVDPRRDDKTPKPDRDHFVELLNDGAGLVLHAGHGQSDRWEQCVKMTDLTEVHNADRLPIIVSAGCTTAQLATQAPYDRYVDIAGVKHRGTDHGEKFAAPPPPPRPYQQGRCNPPSFGKEMLRGGPSGAVAYIGCNTGAQPCDLTLLDGFAATLGATRAGGEPPRLGDCWTGAVAYYYDHEHLADLQPTRDWYPPSVFFQAMKFMVYGDPSLVMPGPSPK